MPGNINLPPLGSSSGRAVPSSGLVPILPTPTPSRMPYGATPYGRPSVGPSLATAQGQFSASQRPFSFPSGQPQPRMIASAQQPNLSSYGYGSNPQLSSSYPPAEYPTPLFPRRDAPPQTAAESMSYYGPPTYQLPPILPAPPSTNLDPAMAQHRQRQYQSQDINYAQQPFATGYAPSQSSRASDERDPKRPKMDMRNILGPRE